MKDKPTTYRLARRTLEQIDQLAKMTGHSKANVIQTAIDRMYQQETRTMKTYIVTNERYSNEPVPTTLADLEQLARDHDWDAEFTETHRNGADIIVDNRGDVVAVEPGHERKRW